MPIETLTPGQYEIIAELMTVIDYLGGKSDIIMILGSWGDTLPEKEILELVQQWNANPPAWYTKNGAFRPGHEG